MVRSSSFIVAVSLLLIVSACSRSDDGNSDTDGSANTGSSESTSGKKQPWSGKSLDEWTIVYAEMQEILDMSDNESQELKATFKKHVEKLQAWYRKHGPGIAEADRAAMEAARNRDLAKLRQLKNEVVPLKQEAMAMHQAMDTAVLNTLAEPNRIRWQAHRLKARFMKLAEPLQLTESQKTLVAQKAMEAAQKVKDRRSPQGAGFLELEKRVEASVLDDKQRASYQGIKSKNKLRSLKKYSSFQPTEK